jgi:4-hydroxybenzoate polyprenyltransferase
VAHSLDLPDFPLLTDARSYLDNVRMQDWGGYIGMAILGYMQGIETIPQNMSEYINFILYLASIAFYLGFSFSVNNCFDYEGDKLGAKISLNPIAAGRISVNGGILFSGLLATMGLAFTWFFFGPASFTIYAVMLALSGAYSTPPLRLKSMPLIDMASHGLFFGSLIVFYGVVVTGGFNAFTLPLLFSVYTLSLILELRNQIDDIDEDSATFVDTTVVRIGSERANTLFYGLIALHMGILAIIVSLLGNFALTFSAVVFFVSVALYFYRMPNRDKFLLIMERVTPAIYILFLFKLILF